MAWPINARYQTFVANVTTITAAFLNDIQDRIYHLIGGTRSILKAGIDGVGNQDSSAVPTGTLQIEGKSAEATPSLKFSDTVTAYNVRIEGTGASVKSRMVQTTTGWELWTNCYYVAGGGDNWARDTAGTAATRVVMLSGTMSVYYYDTPPATWATAAWATRQSLGTTITGDVTAAQDVNALAGKVSAGETIASATVGAGQTVGLGDIYKDTTIRAWGVVTYTGATTIQLVKGAGVQSITRNAAGTITVLLTTATPTSLAPAVTFVGASLYHVYLVAANLGTTSFQVIIDAGAGAADPAIGDGFSFVCSGG